MNEAALAQTPRRTSLKPTPSIHEIQAFNLPAHLPIALYEKHRQESVDYLNQLPADTITIRDLCRKHHRQTSGATFHQLHLLFDKYYREQHELVAAG